MQAEKPSERPTHSLLGNTLRMRIFIVCSVTDINSGGHSLSDDS
jgi:hypothetical protein